MLYWTAIIIIYAIALIIWNKQWYEKEWKGGEMSEKVAMFLVVIIPILNILYILYHIFQWEWFKKKTISLKKYSFWDVVLWNGVKNIYIKKSLYDDTHLIASESWTEKVSLSSLSLETSELTEYVKLLADSDRILKEANKLKEKAKKAKANLFN